MTNTNRARRIERSCTIWLLLEPSSNKSAITMPWSIWLKEILSGRLRIRTRKWKKTLNLTRSWREIRKPAQRLGKRRTLNLTQRTQETSQPSYPSWKSIWMDVSCVERNISSENMSRSWARLKTTTFGMPITSPRVYQTLTRTKRNSFENYLDNLWMKIWMNMMLRSSPSKLMVCWKNLR